MTTQHFTLFETAIGACGLVWGKAGIVGAFLPERDAAATRARLQRRFAAAVEVPPTAEVQAAAQRIVALMDGEADDLATVALDMGGLGDFDRAVYAIARAIPPGETLTYGEIAARLGDRTLARGVGQSLGRNPYPIIVPCHRVLGMDGKVGGFSAPGGVSTKMRMLAIEGARTSDAPMLFDAPLAIAPRRPR
jgi:methylated-DNA-[protein]-cysteine S-methyltransferase